MNRKSGFNKLYLILLLPFTLFINFLASRYPELVERYYSQVVYKYLSQLISGLTGLLPISLAELLFIVFIAVTLSGLYLTIKRIIKYPKDRFKIITGAIANVLIAISLLYFAFIFMWGLNYHRLPFGNIEAISSNRADIEDLEELCRYLISRANYLRNGLEENSDGVMVISTGVRDVLKRAQKGYDAATKIFPELGGTYGNPKGIFFSIAMSYQGVGGIFIPFTGEANVNTNEPDVLLPFTALHEMAHQRGYAREDEANFIGYITAIMHSDRDFQYSGTMLALHHSMGALRRQDYDRFKALREEYSPGVIRDFEDWNRYYTRYEGVISRASNRVNEAYLQANAQRDGVQSYGRMVDLLLAYYREVR
jgi:hypothetical protein